MQTFATRDANVCDGGCKRLREKMQCTAMADAVHCKDGCSALRERLQCTASEMGKTGTETVSPLFRQEKREERHTPIRVTVSPQVYPESRNVRTSRLALLSPIVTWDVFMSFTSKNRGGTALYPDLHVFTQKNMSQKCYNQ